MRTLTSRLYIFFLIFILASPISVSGQDRPKIGLVLSGGGAKGMAHIGVLKKLEEAGIRPDYITGTSMGSIIGGLYAAGYTPDEIEKIALNINWDEVLSNKISIDRINYQEKPYYERFILELGINKFKLELPKGLIDGQRLTEILYNVTRNVHDVDDFNNLPIPFACVATDITTGEAIVLNKGSLAMTLRASMAIPSVFTPVEIDDHLLVDGGLVRNFPVPECLDMGADIIIGVFVSDDLSGKDDLKSVVDVLTQSAFVMSVFDSRKQKELCDILIEPDLEPYTTFSFTNTREIIERGEEAGEKWLPRLRALADSVDAAPLQPLNRPEIRDSYQISEVKVLYNQTIPDKFIIGKLRIRENENLGIEDIEHRVDALFGTGYFTKVWYTISHSEGKDILTIYVQEDISGKVKLALHYDNENEVGFNINLTKQNLLPGLRGLMEIDIAQNPRLDMNLLKYLGERQDWAVQGGVYFRGSEVPILDQFSALQAIYKNKYWNPYVEFLNTGRINHEYGIKMQFESSTLRPNIAGDELRVLDRLAYDSWSLQAFYEKNTLDDRYFPRSGGMFGIWAKYSLNLSYDITITDSLASGTLEFSPDPFPSAGIRHHTRIPLSRRLTLGISDYVVFNFIDRSAKTELDLPYFNDAVFAGGFRPILRNSLPLWGAKPLEFYGDNMFYNEILLQYQLFDKLFIELASQYVNAVYPMQWVYKEAENSDYYMPGDKEGLLSYGLKVSYLTLIGPISFGIASRQETQTWNPFFSIGFYY